jgi:hypothetical protein
MRARVAWMTRARAAWMDCLDICAGRLEPFGSYLSFARRSLEVFWLIDWFVVGGSVDCLVVFLLLCDSMESRTTANVSMYACRHE